MEKGLDEEDDSSIQYKIDETPPLYLCILLAFQHYISMFIATLTVPILLAPAICMGDDNVGKSEITGTLFVASGIITLLQTCFGCRLPVVQAGTFALLVPTLSYLRLPQWECPSNIRLGFGTTAVHVLSHLWLQIQGAIMVAALMEVVFGASGAVGVLLRFVGPLTICPTVALLGLSLFTSAANFASQHWWISITTIFLIVLFSQYLGNINVPCAGYSKERGFHSKGYPLFKMFPIIIAIGVCWLLCVIFTVTDVFPKDPNQWGHMARTDLRVDALYSSPWFRLPYPGQWGMPTVSLAAVCALLSGVLSTIVESVGDYHACAKLAGAPPPPLHAVNRGILVEGIGTLLDGMFGTGNGTTSTSINVGVVGITKVGSRRVVQVSALFMIVFGIFTKFGALFITIPDPIIGGTFFILFGMIVAVGISNLQYVDLNSSRNLFIIGFSFFNGLALSEFAKNNPGTIHTGSNVVDNIFQVLLSTNMFVGGVTGFILDNTIPGTEKERGIAIWKDLREAQKEASMSQHMRDRLSASYDLPFGMQYIRKIKFLRYVPFSPTYQQYVAVDGFHDEERTLEVDRERNELLDSKL
ncbi:hypothetical protein CAPTEDRAFT_174485 [Capitella teleta]|uniref:Uncharacterized protein n=1 Tax=Capitella teleta TaxID=283909 RepID=R7V7A2_CAPTE|nr:hypothetical protein CAPTEDRAFT_174485 [Capitella teleta]|eukprot:ELU12246.1 hypothetical protein CAPTEDRAFT_174485 [Capitella teleta]